VWLMALLVVEQGKKSLLRGFSSASMIGFVNRTAFSSPRAPHGKEID
jgi:hypothetical protein